MDHSLISVLLGVQLIVLGIFTLMWGAVFASAIRYPQSGRAEITWSLIFFIIGLIATAFQVGVISTYWGMR